MNTMKKTRKYRHGIQLETGFVSVAILRTSKKKCNKEGKTFYYYDITDFPKDKKGYILVNESRSDNNISQSVARIHRKIMERHNLRLTGESLVY
nr:MAG TPA: hypothetical protein [Caudoviricetes sp.]